MHRVGFDQDRTNEKLFGHVHSDGGNVGISIWRNEGDIPSAQTATIIIHRYWFHSVWYKDPR